MEAVGDGSPVGGFAVAGSVPLERTTNDPQPQVTPIVVTQTQQEQVTGNVPEPETLNQPPVDQVFGSTRLKSVVWNHLTRIKLDDETKTKCIYCHKLLGGDSNNGTSHLRSHMKSCLQKRIKDGAQKVLGPKYSSKGKKDMVATAYSYDMSKKELATAILVHEYPLSMVDHLHFKRFLCSLQPLFTVPCRNTMKKEILGMFDSERGKIRKIIDNNMGRVTLTTDMWTATTQKKGYMAVTAHYIDNSWNLRSHLLRFMYILAPHTSERLATVLIECMMDWNVDSKVSTITLDNCSTNDSMMDKIKKKMVLSYLLRDGALLHMRCSAHVLNLIVKDGLELLKDGIEKIRDSVVYWTATSKRSEFFEETARQVKVSCHKKLVLDCPTRWNSIYLMLATALPYQRVFIRLSQRDSQYTSLPSTSHWQFAAIVCEKLEVFSLNSDLFSGSKYPTANIFFPRICDLKVKLNEWLLDDDPVIKTMATSMWLKFKKYWDVIHELLAT